MNALAAIGYPLFLVAALNFGLGIILFGRGTRDPLAHYAAAIGFLNAVYCTVMGLAYVRASFGLSYDLDYRLAWVGWLGLAPIIQIVLTLKGDAAGARSWGRVLYVLWGIILVLCVTTDLVEAGAVSLVPFIDRTGAFEQPARALGTLTLGWALFEMYRVQRVSVGRRRQQLGYLLLGLALYAAIGMFFAGVFQIVDSIRFDPGLVSYFSLAWTALTFYAITRHRLFDIRFVVSRASVALVLTALLIGFDVALFQWISPVVGPQTAMVIVSILSGVAFFMTPLIRLVEKGTHWLLVRRAYDHQRAMNESARALATLVSVDDILERLLEVTHQTIGTSSSVLLIRDGELFRRKQTYGIGNAPAELPADSALVGWLAQRGTIFVRDEQAIALPPDRLARLDDDLGRFAGEVAVAIRYQSDFLGILILGRKADKDAFLQADLDLLEMLANEAAIAVTNARLVEELRDAVRARDDFVSVAGHELRTPLAALQLNIQILSRIVTDVSVRERLAATERQVARLTRLTNDLLDASRIAAGRMVLEYEPTDLGATVREIAARFAEELSKAARRIDLTLAESVIGSWDRLRIEQVVTNLLSNAMKYGGPEPIVVTVERAHDRARLTVRDRGIGIDESDQGRIFERFERAVAQQHVSGFGLGLWITKQVVEAHGGTISVHSAPGVGSTFIVELPITAVALSPTPPRTDGAAAQDDRRP